MEEQANIQEQAAAIPRRLPFAPLMSSLKGNSFVYGDGLPRYTEKDRDGALVILHVFTDDTELLGSMLYSAGAKTDPCHFTRRCICRNQPG